MKDLEAEEKEGKISHKDNLAKNNGTKQESMEDETSEQPVEECGGDEGMVQLSMKDLLQLVKQLEKGGDVEPQHAGHPLMGAPGDLVDAEEQQIGQVMDAGFDEEFANAAPGDAGPAVQGIAAVTPTGDDMNSKGRVSPAARAPGTNALRPVSEELVQRLHQYYDYVKTRNA